MSWSLHSISPSWSVSPCKTPLAADPKPHTSTRCYGSTRWPQIRQAALFICLICRCTLYGNRVVSGTSVPCSPFS